MQNFSTHWFLVAKPYYKHKYPVISMKFHSEFVNPVFANLISQQFNKPKFVVENAQHAWQKCIRTISHCRVIPESSWSTKSSWSVWKPSGRKAMLSLLGGAVMTSSGAAFSLDSWSGNIRQDETHPDTLMCLSTVTKLKFCFRCSFPQKITLFLTMLKCLNAVGEKYCVFGETPQPVALSQCTGSAETIYKISKTN